MGLRPAPLHAAVNPPQPSWISAGTVDLPVLPSSSNPSTKHNTRVISSQLPPKSSAQCAASLQAACKKKVNLSIFLFALNPHVKKKHYSGRTHSLCEPCPWREQGVISLRRLQQVAAQLHHPPHTGKRLDVYNDTSSVLPAPWGSATSTTSRISSMHSQHCCTFP